MTADWVVPVTAPPIKNGAILIEDNFITQFGQAKEIIDTAKDAEQLRHVGILSPGLINAHSHLDYSFISAAKMPDNFRDWIPSLVEHARETLEQNWIKAVVYGVDSTIRAGVTSIIDIDSRGYALEPLRKAGIRGISLLEVVAGDIRDWPAIVQRVSGRHSNKLVGTGYSPHSIYGADYRVLEEIKRFSQYASNLIAIHVAESIYESEWITGGTGPLRDMLKQIGASRETPSKRAASTIKYLDSIGILGANTALIHCVHVDQEDIETIKRTNSSVVICPRSNNKLQVGIPPLKEFMEAGINIAIGTDSLASCPDLSILNEMRYLTGLFPEIDKNSILWMGTVNGSRLFNPLRPLGSIKVGAFADIAAWSFRQELPDDPVSALLDATLPVFCEYVVVDGNIKWSKS